MRQLVFLLALLTGACSFDPEDVFTRFPVDISAPVYDLATAPDIAAIEAVDGMCPTERTLCGELCVDTHFDNANCGACGTACTGGTYCTDSRCVLPPDLAQIPDSALVMDASEADFTVVDSSTPLDSATLDMTMRDQATPDLAAPDLATPDLRLPDLVVLPDLTCPGGLQLCAGKCLDVTTDPQNCGGCAKKCDPNLTPYCLLGMCTDLIPYGKPCPNGVSGMCQTKYCSSQLICTNRAKGDPCGVNGDCMSQVCAMGKCQ